MQKILIIISIVVIIGGIICGINIRNELMNNVGSTENMYVDGTDVSTATNIFVVMGANITGIAMVIYSILIVGIIWIIYGIILLFLKINNKNREE